MSTSSPCVFMASSRCINIAPIYYPMSLNKPFPYDALEQLHNNTITITGRLLMVSGRMDLLSAIYIVSAKCDMG